MELHYRNLVPHRQGYDFELAETASTGERMRVRIHADKSYPEQSFAVGEVWMKDHGWVECATLLKANWVFWGRPSPEQDSDCVRSIDEACDELMARMAATLGL